VSRRPVVNLAASIHRRLLNEARGSSRPFNELLQYYAMRQFMARLARSRHADRFVLKGGLLMDAWSASSFRPTVDIDFLGMMDNDPSAVESIIREVCATEVEPDGLAFLAENGRAERITEHANYQGVRMRFEARLGSAKVPMQVDIGFGDVVLPGIIEVRLRPLLDFAPTSVQAYSRESSIAEKFQAMVKLGSINSRMNDFFDLWYLSMNFDFEGETLAAAIAATFQTRSTAIPRQVAAFATVFADNAEKQAQWRSFRSKSRLDEAPESLGQVVRQIESFLGPLTRAASVNESFGFGWKPPGPWTAGSTAPTESDTAIPGSSSS
jgi:predicted nucleotidyltransferase component of viral defense system